MRSLRDHVRISRAQLREYRLASADQWSRPRPLIGSPRMSASSGRVLMRRSMLNCDIPGLPRCAGSYTWATAVFRASIALKPDRPARQANRELTGQRGASMLSSAPRSARIRCGPCPRGVDDANDGGDTDPAMRMVSANWTPMMRRASLNQATGSCAAPSRASMPGAGEGPQGSRRRTGARTAGASLSADSRSR